MSRDEWMQKGACYQSYEPAFFPNHGDSRGAKKIALAYCNVCPVTEECLEYSLTLGSHMKNFGTWGGKTTRERQRLRRSRQ